MLKKDAISTQATVLLKVPAGSIVIRISSHGRA
jgi:hypothetical protein